MPRLREFGHTSAAAATELGDFLDDPAGVLALVDEIGRDVANQRNFALGNSTAQSPSHTYAAGTWTVRLIASNAGGSSTNTKPSYITAWTPFQSWQVQYFGSTTNPVADGSIDADGDGQSNLAEFYAGTDPTNSMSALRITSITAQGANVLISWTMGAGKTNTLQVTSGDPGGSYATNGFVDLFVATNTVGTITNGVDEGGATNSATRYYRVRLVP